MAAETKSSQILIRVRPSLKAGAEKAAAEDHRSLSSLIEKLLTDHLRKKGISTEIADARSARRSQSKRMAGDAMDREMKHSGVSDDEKNERKRRLMKMPGELSSKPTRGLRGAEESPTARKPIRRLVALGLKAKG